MSTGEVTALIAAMRSGDLSLEEVADRFRQRTWPSSTRPTPTTYEEMAEQQDPGTDVPGSYDDVTAAYDRGEITSEQYQVLSDAVADAINAQAARKSGNEPV